MKVTEKGLITDFDNTLVATRDFILRHLLHTTKRLKIKPPPKNKIVNILKKNPPFEEIFNSLFGKEGPSVLEAYREDAMQTPYKAISGALRLVKSLNRKKAKIAIVSNRTNKLVERLVQAKYNPKHFIAIIQPASPKPSKDAYKEALTLLQKKGTQANDIFIMGDSIDDYQAVRRELKNNFYAVSTGPNTRKEFLKAGLSPKQIISSPIKLLAQMYGRN